MEVSVAVLAQSAKLNVRQSVFAFKLPNLMYHSLNVSLLRYNAIDMLFFISTYYQYFALCRSLI